MVFLIGLIALFWVPWRFFARTIEREQRIRDIHLSNNYAAQRALEMTDQQRYWNPEAAREAHVSTIDSLNALLAQLYKRRKYAKDTTEVDLLIAQTKRRLSYEIEKEKNHNELRPH